MKIKKLGALLVSAALCAGMAAPAFAFEGETAPVEQPVLPEMVEDIVTVTDETSGALTPEGNLTLVDDYHTNYSDGSGQQFITLVSKSGRAVAKEMGYTAEIQNVNFDGLIPAMESGNIDIIASGMTINEERKNQVEFSDPYYTSGLTIVVPKDNTDINGFADLKGKKIAVQIGTTSMEEAQKIEGAEVKALNSSADTFMELKAGNVDAVINDLPVNDYYIVKTKATDVKRLDDKLTSEEYGFAMKKGNTELKQKVDAALKTLKENGEYDKIYEKWFGTKPAK